MVKESKKNLLLVEDEAVIAMMEKRQLQKYGYNVITVLTGEKAIQSIDEGQLVDLILMDINLGTGMDGTETASMILRTRDIPVIFLSSHTEPEVVERTENISSYGYVVKSSSITVLDASIKMAFKLFEANTTIRQSDEKQRVMISNITDVLGIVDADGTIRYHSPNIERLFGWNSLELAGTKVWFAFHPEDLGGIRGEYAVLLGGHNSARSVECRYRCKDGSYKTVDLTVMNLIDDPIIHGFLLNFHDVSHRKSAEEALLASETRYRRLFEAAQDGIMILDAESGRIVDVNPFLIDMMGYAKDQFIEKKIWEIGFFKDVIANQDNFRELQEREYVRYENLPLETAHGKNLDVEFISNVYIVDGQKVIQCNVREITERVRSEIALGEIHREKEELFHELQHRVKNSFALISGMIGLALGEAASPETAVALSEVDVRVRSVAELYSLLYASGSFKEVRLDEYCAKLARAMLGLSDNIALVTEMEPITVSAKQAAPIGLIVTELVTNVQKYAFPSGRKGRVTLSLRRVPSGVLLEVRDDGVGTAADSGPNGSAGFGLKLVQDLTRQIGGSFAMRRLEGGTSCALDFVEES